MVAAPAPASATEAAPADVGASDEMVEMGVEMAGGCCSLRLSLADVGPLTIPHDLSDSIDAHAPRPYVAAASIPSIPFGQRRPRPAPPTSPFGSRQGLGARGPSRRRRHTTMVTRAEFREVVAARSDGRALDPMRLVSRDGADDRRLVSVLLTDEEVERLQLGRADAYPHPS